MRNPKHYLAPPAFHTALLGEITGTASGDSVKHFDDVQRIFEEYGFKPAISKAKVKEGKHGFVFEFTFDYVGSSSYHFNAMNQSFVTVLANVFSKIEGIGGSYNGELLLASATDEEGFSHQGCGVIDSKVFMLVVRGKDGTLVPENHHLGGIDIT